MKNIKYILITIIVGLLFSTGFTSCNLNTEPPAGGSTLTPDEAWKDVATYQTFLAKLYACFALSGNSGPNGNDDIAGSDQGEATFSRSYWNLQELTTDEAVCAWSDDGLNGLMFCNWNANNRFAQLTYNRTLMTVSYCNEYLRNTTDDVLAQRGVDDNLKAKIKTYRAEARAIRAMQYYFLMDLYANVAFVDENSPVGDVSFLPEQKGRDFLFSFVESELNAVINDLPAKTAANYGRINQYVANMVLANLYMNANVYLGTPKYTEAITCLNKVISGGYTLDNDYCNLFMADNDQSPEIIFPIIFDGKKATCYGGTTYLMAAAYGTDFFPAINLGLNQSWSGLRAKETLVDIFTDAADARGNKLNGSKLDKNGKVVDPYDAAHAMFWTTMMLVKGNDTTFIDRPKETSSIYDFKYGYGVVKFKNLRKDGAPASDPAFPDTDFPFYRLADVYLLYAEAVLRGGQGGDRATALGYVNAVRNRAQAGTISDAQLTLNFLLDERARELYWEGHRRTDLIRFDKFTSNYRWPWKNGVYQGTANINDKYKIFPIPNSEIGANPNIKQNPGY